LICHRCREEIHVKSFLEYYCFNCEEVVEEPENLYECSECGEVYNRDDSYDGMSHRCPSCGRWGHIYIENTCPECQAEEELKKIKVVKCPKCGELYPLTEKPSIWRTPYKRGQKLILVKPYRGEGFEGRPGRPIGFDWDYGEGVPNEVLMPTYAKIIGVDRESQTLDLDITEKTRYGGWGSHPKFYVTVDELEKYWRAVSEEEFNAWLKQM